MFRNMVYMATKNKVVKSVPDTSEKTTKERIFEATLDLFAQKGFDAVSMREVAEAVGIKKASLYSHFSCKDDLLEQIIDYPITRLANIGPQGADTEQMITSMGVEGFMTMAGGVFNRWIASPEMEKVWRIICIELYHDSRIKQFYGKFTGEAIAFWRSNFSIMMKHGLIKRSNPDVLAREYLAFYLYTFMDHFLVNYDASSSFLQAKGKELDDHMTFLVKSIKA